MPPMPNNIHLLSPQTLRQWLDAAKRFTLIDPMPPDHFSRSHLPGAVNACVFEVTFLDQAAAIAPDNRQCIVLYGAGRKSLEADVAVEKLQRRGYTDLHVLEGGLDAWWNAGYALEGTAPDPPAAENRLALKNGSYRIDEAHSAIAWAGRNPNTKHDGILHINGGTITVENGMPVGTVEIDMQRIENHSLRGDDLQPVLIAHLKSDDFFFSDRFPTATFVIRSARARETLLLGAPNLDIQGELTLRGMTAGLDLAAAVSQADDGTITAWAQLELDRTRWNIIYGSARFFEHLGMHLVFDLISIDIHIVAVPAG